MILIRILGLLDMICGIVILILKFGYFQNLGIILSFFLALKSIIFIKDIASVIDLISAVFFFLAANGYYFNFTWIFALWLIQKGLFSIVYN